MNPIARASAPPTRPTRWPLIHAIPATLLALATVAPPETRGESMAGCAALIALLALLSVRRSQPVRLALPLGLAAVAAPVLVRSAAAPGAAVEAVALWGLALSLGLLAAGLPHRGRARTLCARALVVGGVCVSIHGLFQVLGGLDRIAGAVEHAPDLPWRELTLARLREGRAFAAFATPAALGGLIALSLACTVGIALERSRRWRGYWWLAAAMQLAGLAATASATACAALLAAASIGAWRLDRRRGRVILAAGLAVTAVAVVGIFSSRGAALLDPTRADGPLRLRAANMRVALEMTRDQPWLGVGPGGFGEMYPQYRRPGDNESQHAHNLPLELTAEFGIPLGGLMALGFGVLFLGPLLRLPPHARPVRVGLVVGLGAFGLHNLADFTAYFPSLLWIAMVLRGLLGFESRALRERAGSRAPGLGFAVTAVTLVAAGVMAAGGLAWNARFAARESRTTGDLAAAEARASRALRLAPWHTDGWLMAADAALAQLPPAAEEGATERAALLVERAVECSPVRPGARYLRSRIRLLRGDPLGAFADARFAVERNPLRSDYRAWHDALVDRLERSRSLPQ